MTYYAGVTVSPTSDEWIPGYVGAVGDLVAKHGGKYLARTASFERLEGDGDNPGLMVLIEWPSKEAAMAFYNDTEYQPHLEARLAGSDGSFFLIEGKDDLA